MFVGSTKGGEAAALFYALAGTCRLNGVQPEAWFTDVIERIGSHPINRIEDFLPWRWGLSSNGTENLHKARLQASSMPVTLGSRSGRSSPRATMSGMVKA